MKKLTLSLIFLFALIFGQAQEEVMDSLQTDTLQTDSENEKALLEIVFGFDAGYTNTTFKPLNATGIYSSSMWTYDQKDHTGEHTRDKFKINGVWFCGNIGIRLPVYRIKGFELGVGLLGGFGLQRQTSISIDDSEIENDYFEYLHSLYWDVRAEAYFNYYFNPAFRLTIRAGVKLMRTDQMYTLPNLEFGIGFKYVEIGVSGNFVNYTYYREFTTGEREVAKVINYPVSGFIRGTIPIKKKKKAEE